MVFLFLLLQPASAVIASSYVPAFQPPIVLGKFALRDSNIGTGTLAYRPLFENINWQGDLVQYEIDALGNLASDAQPGASNPAVAGSSGGCGKPAPAGCWTATASFEKKRSRISDYWKQTNNGRHIFTYADSNGDGIADTQVAFLWNQLGNEQRALLDPATSLDSTSSKGAYDSPILNYIRGDDSLTIRNGGRYRNRSSLLGDIVNSSPVYIGAPREHYTLPGFIAFKNRYSGDNRRPGRIAVGANDGMLHVFDEDDGSEVYAYIPSMLLNKLGKLAQPGFNKNTHTSFVDGQLTSVSAQINGQWKTVLAGGLGAGNSGLFALDLTKPGPGNNKILFELTADDIGHIYSQPSIVRLADKSWYLVSGNGYGSRHGGRLLLVNLNDGSYRSISTGVAAGLSGATVVDSNADHLADIAYAGDTDGNVWKFYLGEQAPPVNPERIYQPPAAIGTNQPVTTRPEVAVHPQGGYMIMFGTGSLTSLADTLSAQYPQQALYGIRDSGNGTTIVERHIETRQDAVFINGDKPATASIRLITANQNLAFDCIATADDCVAGWKITLPDAGERVSGAPQLRNGRLVVVTGNPADPGNNWLMSINYLSGDDGATAVFDLNGDAQLDNSDTLNIGTQKSPAPRAAIGLHLGNGYLSQPTLARLKPGVDALYINGLLMPAESVPQRDGPLLFGHLDVITSSPSGGKQSSSKITAGKNQSGQAIDAHVHEYDTQHNVSYVDILQLEPRRNLQRITLHSASDCNPSSDKNAADCLQQLPARLDRLLDDPLYNQHERPGSARQQLARSQSEVFIAGTTTPLSSEQKFVVVIANADLSPAAELQIGCRSWNAQQYQDMITQQLEAGKMPQQLQDSAHNNASLVFSLADIVSDSEFPCPLNSPQPTLRVSFGALDIVNGGLHGTRTQCVLGQHDYRKAVSLPNIPPHNLDSSQSDNPAHNLHITELPRSAGSGSRWRNGALTVQLLKVNNDTGRAEFTLQDPLTLPLKGSRIGGTYARAFSRNGAANQVTSRNRIHPGDSGLIHETVVFWHYGEQSGGAPGNTPVNAPCYGHPSWRSAIKQALRGLTAQQYLGLYNDIDVQLLRFYDTAMLSLQSALATQDNDAVADALHSLDILIEENDELAQYDQYREYAPYTVAADKLRELDKRLPGRSLDTGNREESGTAIIDLNNAPNNKLQQLLPGPAYSNGRRAWIELDE